MCRPSYIGILCKCSCPIRFQFTRHRDVAMSRRRNVKLNPSYFTCILYRYLRKARYKKGDKKDKTTNVISVQKKVKNQDAVSAVAATTTATNSSKTSIIPSNCNAGGVPFIIPKIEHPGDESTAATIVCKPFEPNNISSSTGNTL